MKKILPLFFVLSQVVYGQQSDYTQYYTWMNEARNFSRANDLEKSDSVSSLALSSYNGFADDYFYALLTRFRLTQQIDTSYFISMAKNGELWQDSKYALELMGVTYFKEFKKLYRKNKFKKSNNGFPIARLIVRDQLYRSKIHFLVRKNADSINLVKLERLLLKKPDLFDRTKTGRLGIALLEPLLIHQSDWKSAQRIFFQIRDRVKQGKLHPSVLIATIHRASTSDGTLFWIENDSLRSKLNGNKKICLYPTIYYSLVHGGEWMLRDSKKIELMPFNPDFTLEQINELRKYLFLPNFQDAFPESHYRILTADEFCLRVLGKY